MDILPPDPFAPLPISPGEKPTGQISNGVLAWEPRRPAPEEPPEPARVRHKHGIPSSHWIYRNEAGEPDFAVYRIDNPKGVNRSKVYLPYTFGRLVTMRDGHKRDVTGWHWKRVEKPLPLYNLDQLVSRPDSVVIITEGEKKAAAVVGIFPDMVGVSPLGGAENPKASDYSPLCGRNVIVWPDNDAASAKFSTAVANLIEAAGGAARIVSIPANWPAKWDLADPLPAGVTVEDLRRLADEAVHVPEEEPESAEGLDAQAEIERLASLSGAEFASERRRAAGRLGMTVKDLEVAVKHERKRAFREKEETRRDQERTTPGAIIWPIGFRMEAHGLTYLGDSDTAMPVTVCSPFQVLGQSRTDASHSWGLHLEWQDPDGKRHQLAMQRRLLMTEPGVLEAELSDRGLRIGATAEARALLRVALADLETTARVTSVSRTGWHKPACGTVGYVLADGSVIGATAEPIVLSNVAENGARRVAMAGSLEDWQSQVSALAVGNPVATFALSCAFVGPLLEIACEDGGGIHLFGASKRGKTVAMKMAASVWGPPDKDGALRDWLTTANALEAACEEATDGLLTLDEIQQCDPKTAVRSVYGMGNGGGKGRMRSDASVRRRRTWRVFFFSNGEISLPTVAQRAGERLDAGAEVRLPSIPIPENLWPNLHGEDDFQKLCARIDNATKRNHGTAARAFLENLAVNARVDLSAEIANIREAFLSAHVPHGADPQVRDVARRCALIAAAGEIAADLRIVPWPKNAATKSAAFMFARWREQRGNDGSGEEAGHLEAVRRFIVQHGASRMQPLIWNTSDRRWEELNDPSRPVINRAGWRTPKDNDGNLLYIFAPETWKTEVCAAVDPTEAAKTLLKAGHLVRGDGSNLPKKETMPGERQRRHYVVKSSLLGDD